MSDDQPLATTTLQDLARQLDGDLVTDPELMAPWCRDASTAEPDGHPVGVVLAASVADVQAAVRFAAATGTHVSVRGGGTGLAGGAVSYRDGLVISTHRLDRIRHIDVADRLATVDAGVLTADLDAAAAAHGLLFAPDPASARTSTIGGNLATNAGGLRCIAHGVTADAVAELEVVMADGSLVQLGAKTRKNVTGYDLVHLMVGSEGTLGIITGATVRLKPRPVETPVTFMAAFDSLDDAVASVVAITGLAARPEVLELVDAASCRLIEAHHPSGLPQPGAALLVGQCVGVDARYQAEAVVRLCRELGASTGATAEGDALLEARRLANPAMAASGHTLMLDVGVPVSRLPAMFAGIDEISRRTGRSIVVVAHAGDGNLHPAIHVGDAPGEDEAAEAVADEVIRLALDLDGTITGEHGIGQLKASHLHWQLDENVRRIQRAIKEALDPKGILTPGRGI